MVATKRQRRQWTYRIMPVLGVLAGVLAAAVAIVGLRFLAGRTRGPEAPVVRIEREHIAPGDRERLRRVLLERQRRQHAAETKR